MKKSINLILAGLLMVPMLAFGFSVAAPTFAGAQANCDVTLTGGKDCAKPDQVPDDLFGEDGIFRTITNAALFLIGAISVIMLIYGGIRYTISGGDTKNVTDAKNTILYAVVGIIVAIMAYAIVNFVITRLTS